MKELGDIIDRLARIESSLDDMTIEEGANTIMANRKLRALNTSLGNVIDGINRVYISSLSREDR